MRAQTDGVGFILFIIYNFIRRLFHFAVVPLRRCRVSVDSLLCYYPLSVVLVQNPIPKKM